MQKTVLIADDHPMFAEGLASLLQSQAEYTVIDYAYNGAEAVEKARTLAPDVVILDVNMPNMSGIEAARHIRQHSATIHIIMLSMNDEASTITQAIEAGANAYLLKNAAKSDLMGALRAVGEQQSYFSAGIAQVLLQKELSRHKHTTKDVEILTPREFAVAKLLVQDLTNAEIADQLHISIRTVEGHRMNILRKLKLKSIVGLANYAAQQGWNR